MLLGIRFRSSRNRTERRLTMKTPKKMLRSLKWKLFLFVTLPIAIVSIGRAVLEEYGKLAVRRRAEAEKSRQEPTE